MSWNLVCHVHTKHSFDCLTEPRALVERAVARGVHVLVVTDHDTWQGSVDAFEEAWKAGAPLRAILAAERATDQGDLIGLFLRDEVIERSAIAYCDRVHEQEGLVLLPHPYRWHQLDDELLQRVDLIEAFNARTARSLNEQAEELARERGLPALAGPDAHRLAELDLASVEFEGDLPADEPGLKRALLTAPRRFHTATGSIWDDWLSQGVRAMRRPTPTLLWNLALGAMRRVRDPGAFGPG